uniref:Ig-like domain-containing protein n=1 Tax=Methanobrevibacter smithii TaxID=2173 RepID=UPI00384B1AFA
MKNKSILLILLSIFILFAFLQGVTALDDNSTNANSNEVLFADNNQIIQSNDEVNLDSETSLTYNDASSGSNIESSSKIPIADENGVLFNDKSDNIPMDHSPNHSSLTLQNDTVYYGNQAQYLLKDISGNPLANAKVTISINGMDYEKTTDNNGIAKLTIKLISNKKYNITASYKGDSQIPAMTSRNVLTVIPTITAEDVEKIFRNKTQYYPKLTDSN